MLNDAFSFEGNIIITTFVIIQFIKKIRFNYKNKPMKSFGPKAWILPQPVLIIGTYNNNGTPNVMNAAWVNN